MRILSRISFAFRFVFKRKGYAAINILGLALGISACIYITQYVMFHRSFDKHVPEPNRTYRVTYQRWKDNGDRVEFASASPTIGPTIARLFPEVEKFGRAYRVGGVFAYNDFVWEEENAFWGETELIKILGFEIINGSIDSCLTLANQTVISESIANKYFPNIDPVGKALLHNGNEKYIVTAVYKDPPANSHFKPDLFISLENWIRQDQQFFDQGWFYSGFYTYVLLTENANPKDVDKKIEEFISDEYGEFLEQYQTGISFCLQPLADIHLNSHFMHELELNSDSNSIALLQIIAWFILIVAWVNFFNLSTISSLKRVKEIGIRKVNGATQRQLIGQLLLESAILNLCAILAAIVIFELGYNTFANIAGLPPQTDYYQHTWFYILVCVAFIVGTFSSGIYSITRVKDSSLSESLRGAIVNVKGGTMVKKGLVTFQFAIAIALIAATMGVYRQFNLLQEIDLGFRLNDMLVVKVPRVGDNTLHSKFDVFINTASTVPSVKGATYSSVVPGKPNTFNRGGIHRQGDDPNNGKNMRLTEIFSNFPDTYSINLLAGKGFTGNPTEDANNVMLNEQGALWLGFDNFENAIGSQIVLEGIPRTLVGILYNFKQLSPKEEIEPQIFRYPQRFQGYFTVHIDRENREKTIRKIKDVFDSIFPGNAYEYFFLDEFYNKQYQHDKRFSLVFVLFAGLSIVVTIMGLLGLSAYSAEQRKREIGIRKVLGASPSSVVRLLFREYLLLLVIASGVAIPVVYKFLNEWLNNFATRIDVEWTLFMLPLVVVFSVAFVTVFAQSLKAALVNPVESVKQE